MKNIDAIWGNIFKRKSDQSLDVRQFLKNIPLFAQLRKRELREIEHLIHRRQYKKDEVIFWQNEPGVGMYIVQSGDVGIFGEYNTPEQRSFARLTQGDFFGEMALLEDDNRSATAVALAESQLIGIFHPDLFDLFERKPELGIKVLSKLANMLAQRLRKTNLELQQLTGGRRPQKKDKQVSR
ncbi:MAG: cyclic nucleotide-binding domain-containing protein [Candidatus Aminicenantes bacterium]|nr:cyclic nucleotide-binding domain-containing protein [Candidatus Aminicenantes bacterium]